MFAQPQYQQQGQYPPQGFPQQGYPQQGHPQGYPQQGYPPQQGYVMPQQGFHQPHGQPQGYMHPVEQSSDSSDFAGKMDGSMVVSACPPEIRNGFIVKVYSILSVQLIFTCLIGGFISQQPREWIMEHFYLRYLGFFLTLGLLLGSACCCRDALRRYPTNYFILGGVTLGISITTGFYASAFTTNSIIQALFATAAVVIGLTMYACTTKSDFTGMGPYLFAALLALSAFGFVLMLFSMFGGMPEGMRTIYAGCGVLLFSFYIVYDTQLIVGGDHKKCQFSIDDYCFAAINIYIDIIDLFMFLLELFGSRRD